MSSNILAVTGRNTIEDFTVIDPDTRNPVTGLADGDFTKRLYDPSDAEVSSTVTVAITELGNGNYRAEFTPNAAGTWYLTVSNYPYIPNGKGGTIQVYDSDFDSISDQNRRILGLVHQNIVIDETVFDTWHNMESARVRIYVDSAKTQLLATYRINCTTIGPGRFSSWEQVEE
jgi:hypothetical protein